MLTSKLEGEKIQILGVRYKPCSKIYNFTIPDNIHVAVGDCVVVESDMGLSLAYVIRKRYAIEKKTKSYKKIQRIATEEDFARNQENQLLEKEARSYCASKINELNLPMKQVGTETTLDRKRIIFYFTAEKRVDFRELVRILASKFKTRIEMRQIGVRDEVKLKGGIGMCGREVCCRLFLTDFEPISIKMAKKQEMVLNPSKLSGLCGRLMCCIAYEEEGEFEKSIHSDTSVRKDNEDIGEIKKDREKTIKQDHNKMSCAKRCLIKMQKEKIKKFYITTPIYYVNDVPHIGHAYTTVACDVLARYHRLLGEKVFFITGTDEHGQKVEKSAKAKGVSPQEHANKLVKNFKQLWNLLNITNNAFIRTTNEAHIKIVQEMLQRLKDKGDIVKREYTGWYCTHDEMFLAENERINNNCPHCLRAVERIHEENYFFLMGKYQNRLIEYIDKHPDYILPETRRNEVLGFLKNQRLEDLCISRPIKRLSWGVPIPFDSKYVTYVWFDALMNYISATRYLSPSIHIPWWPANHHVIGKDILITHAVYWSTILFSLNIPLPENIFAHGWWTVDGKKMSKSLGNVVNPSEIIGIYGSDAFRYFLLREVPFGLDGNFSKASFIGRINSELANDLGNLVNRTISMIFKYCSGMIPKAEDEESELKNLAEGLLKRISQSLNGLSFEHALEQIWELVSYTNRYIDHNAPWVLVKSSKNKGRLATVLYSSAEALRFLAMYLNSFMPVSTQKIWEQISADGNLSDIDIIKEAQWGKLKSGIPVKKGKPLFPRVEKNRPLPK